MRESMKEGWVDGRMDAKLMITENPFNVIFGVRHLHWQSQMHKCLKNDAPLTVGH